MSQIVLNITPELNELLNMELPLMTGSELAELSRYARYLRWSRTAGENWTDEPLTADEEAGLSAGRENKRRGDNLTLSEFLEQVFSS